MSYRIHPLILGLGMLMLISSLLSPAHATDNNDIVSNQIIVKLNPLSGATIQDINKTYNTTTLNTLAPELGIYLLQVAAGHDSNTLLTQMLLDTRLLYAELHYIGEAPEGNPRNISAWGGFDDTLYRQQDALTQLGVPKAHSISRGAGVIVAVIDTGIQLDHPALKQSILTSGYDFVDGDTVPDDSGNAIDDDGDGTIDEMLGHGTHVAGIIHLIAPEAQIMPIRVLNSDGYGQFFALSESIDYAVAHGADVINLSLGTSYHSDMLEEAIQHATRQGVVVVAAAGNLNTDTQQYPAAEDCSLSVTSLNQNDVKSSFANYGSWIVLSAPGEGIYSAFPGNGYASWSGTSMAAPFVAGQAALLRAVAPTANVHQIAALMFDTGKNTDAQNTQFKGHLGQRINIGASLESWQLHGIPVVTDDKDLMDSACATSTSNTTVYLPLIR